MRTYHQKLVPSSKLLPAVGSSIVVFPAMLLGRPKGGLAVQAEVVLVC